MYAVIRTGGKQYRVEEGQRLKVEKLEHNPGDSFEISDILMITDGDKVTLGTPTVGGSKITASVVGHGRHKKINIVKFHRRKHHRKQMGHRQYFTEIQIDKIS